MPVDRSRIHFANSEELCRYVAQETGGVALLSFSCGKDSIATWLQLRRYFARVVPIYRYIVPDLRFVNESLAYYEGFFGVKIHRVPNSVFYWTLRDSVYQPPWRREAICKLVMSWWYADERPAMEWIEDDIRKWEECPGSLKGVGVRAADSLTRRTSIKRGGVIQHDRKAFFPIFDWKVADMTKAFNDVGVKLPVDYRLWNRSFDSCRARFMPELRKHYPDDYERIRFWYPLVDADEQRRAFAAKKEAASATGS